MRVVVGISGASGAFLGVEVLKALRRQPDIEIHLIISKTAEETIRIELGMKAEEIHALADVVHSNKQLGASVASGSFRIAGMIIVPCSMKTLAGLATGYSDNLLLRARRATGRHRAGGHDQSGDQLLAGLLRHRSGGGFRLVPASQGGGDQYADPA